MDYGEAIENPNSKPLTHHEVQARVTQTAQTGASRENQGLSGITFR